MGRAIARFREMALAVRRNRDETISTPLHEVSVIASRNLAKRNLRLLREFEAGQLSAKGYVRLLLASRNHAELSPVFDEKGNHRLRFEGWLPIAMQVESPRNIRALASDAAKESLRWGKLFNTVEPRVQALMQATINLRCEPGSYGKPLARWQRAFDALAPFIEEPPATVSSSPSTKQTGGSRRGGGRPPNDEALARDLLNGWRAYEPDDGRKTKDRYLAQRADVRTLKTPEARQRKIASLLVALNSALHLTREKTKQKRRARE
jgi:hypothetical protein